MSGARALLVDDAALTELLGQVIARELGWEVTVANRVADVPALVEREAPFDLAIVDLSFPQESPATGLDALLVIHRRSAATKLVIHTQGDDWVAELLHDTWQALSIAGAISKGTPTDQQLRILRQVHQDGVARPDPILQPWLPRERSEWRRAENFGRLVKHMGHAKLWQALIDAEREPSYQQLAQSTRLKLNTLKNYRAQLIDDLALFGVADATIREMHAFAQRCRPLLAPFVDARLDPPAPAGDVR